MRKKLSVILVMVVVLSLVIAAPVNAKKPQNSLSGEMELYFNLGFGDLTAPCPNITWAGTIELDGETYGMAFFPTGESETGKAFHFEEIWKIYELPFGFEGGVLTVCPDNLVLQEVVLWGKDKGVTSPNSKYRMNGMVEEALAPFAMWDGRRVHMSGVITWQVLSTPDGDVVAPETAPGTFRIN